MPTRVLLTDDDAAFVDALARVLTRRGLEVAVAYSGEAALETLAHREFDVVVLDQRMPGMDGLATLSALRERDPLTPVILLSGHADVDRVSQVLRQGAVDFLLKPCPVDDLLAAIEEGAERRAIALELASRQPG